MKDWNTIFKNIRRGNLHPFLLKAYKIYWQENTGERVFEKDKNGGREWENLIIVDACRHDLFEEVEGKTRSMVSIGSSTPEWFNNTFNGYHDIVYISANPILSKFKNKKIRSGEVSFYHHEKVWKSDLWDKEIGTLRPEIMREKSLEVAEEYPDKRKIIHFIQPHHPFIENKLGTGINRGLDGGKTPWELLKENKVSKKEVWEAYKSNLELVLKEVRRLSSELGGKTVLTSDHGNALGEKGVYGHPGNLRFSFLKVVPWVEIHE